MIDDGLPMSATEIKIGMLRHNERLWARIWWILMSSRAVVLPWPSGWTEIDHLGTQIESSDPNDHWRPWLEANVGRKGWDWDWNLALADGLGYNHVEIRFLRVTDMTAFSMRWL